MTFLLEVRTGEGTRFVCASLAFMCVAAGDRRPYFAHVVQYAHQTEPEGGSNA